jgi:hypothetical protein
MQLQYHAKPSPHAYVPQLVAPDLYRQIIFPDIPERPMGRIGRDIYPGETEWAQTMARPGWAEMSGVFMGESFMKQVIGLFAEDIRQMNCGIDPNAVYLDPYQESRNETQTAVLSEDHDPNALFTRFDLQAVGQSYDKGVHCDWPRRIIGGVLFFTSAADEGMEGGEFALYSDLDFKDDRICHSPRVEKTFPLRHNQGVLFLNSNTGFHGPTAIRKMVGMRKWVYYSISSRRNVWRTV